MHGKKVLIKHDLLQNANLQNLYCYKIFFLLLVLTAVESSEKRLNIVKAIMLLIIDDKEKILQAARGNDTPYTKKHNKNYSTQLFENNIS